MCTIWGALYIGKALALASFICVCDSDGDCYLMCCPMSLHRTYYDKLSLASWSLCGPNNYILECLVIHACGIFFSTFSGSNPKVTQRQ